MSMQLGIPINCRKMPAVDFNDMFNEAQSYYQMEVLMGVQKRVNQTQIEMFYLGTISPDKTIVLSQSFIVHYKHTLSFN